MSRDKEVREAERKRRCRHPSLRCLVCGKAYDLLRPEESALAAELRAEIRSLQRQLGAGPSTDYGTEPPIPQVERR